jgi:hypothetical protein
MVTVLAQTCIVLDKTTEVHGVMEVADDAGVDILALICILWL